MTFGDMILNQVLSGLVTASIDDEPPDGSSR